MTRFPRRTLALLAVRPLGVQRNGGPRTALSSMRRSMMITRSCRLAKKRCARTLRAKGGRFRD